jgi:hypothetical protein
MGGWRQIHSQKRNSMRQNDSLRLSLVEVGGDATHQVEWFALVNLGIVQALLSGTLSVTEAIERFYHAENCFYVRKQLRNRTADAIMSHGVQLPDLFDMLPAEEAQREFFHELERIRTLCLKLLEQERTFEVVVQPR